MLLILFLILAALYASVSFHSLDFFGMDTLRKNYDLNYDVKVVIFNDVFKSNVKFG